VEGDNMMEDYDLEDCGCRSAEAAKSIEKICHDLNVRNLVPDVVRGVIGAVVDSEIVSGGKIDNVGEEWLKFIKGRQIVKGTVEFVKKWFKQIRGKDVVVTGMKIALKIAEKKAEDEEDKKKKQYSKRFKTAYKELKALEESQSI